MITKLILLTISFINWNIGFSCEMNLPEKILILQNTQNLDILKKFDKDSTNCSKDIIDDVANLLNSVEGKITRHQLREMLASKNHLVEINPEIIELHQLKNLMREQIEIPMDLHLASIDPLNEPNSLSLRQNDQIKVICENCSFEKNQTISVIIQRLDGSLTNLKVKGDFKKMLKAFFVKSFIPPFTEIRKDQIREEFITPIPHTDIVTDLEIMKFYKTNKPLQAGSLVKKSDLNGINLVRAGNHTEVVIENNFLKLRTNGISRNNGSFGDFVEVLDVQKKKKYIGKVVDINKIIVDL
jgi:flagella basal body P-ring formation protein FlgA